MLLQRLSLLLPLLFWFELLSSAARLELQRVVETKSMRTLSFLDSGTLLSAGVLVLMLGSLPEVGRLFGAGSKQGWLMWSTISGSAGLLAIATGLLRIQVRSAPSPGVPRYSPEEAERALRSALERATQEAAAQGDAEPPELEQMREISEESYQRARVHLQALRALSPAQQGALTVASQIAAASGDTNLSGMLTPLVLVIALVALWIPVSAFLMLQYRVSVRSAGGLWLSIGALPLLLFVLPWRRANPLKKMARVQAEADERVARALEDPAGFVEALRALAEAETAFTMSGYRYYENRLRLLRERLRL